MAWHFYEMFMFLFSFGCGGNDWDGDSVTLALLVRELFWEIFYSHYQLV